MQNKERQVVVVPTIKQIGMANLWHLRLRHNNENTLWDTQTLAKKVDHFNEKNIMWCTPCIERKQHINKFPKERVYKSIKNYGVIFFDICGSLQTNTHGGCKYFITSSDDKSRFYFFNLIEKI